MSAPSASAWWAQFRKNLFGKPIATSRAAHERLSPRVGLAVFASDSLSSVAYATEAILQVLGLVSAAALGIQPWISLAIVALIAIIATSYRQTIRAYPQGGGSYIVASDNLGPRVGLVAGCALLIDYILTVAVSVAAGVAAIASAFPSLHSQLVPIAILIIGLLAFANLRGIKESGALFSVPTYGFVLVMYVMLALGIARSVQAGPQVQQVLAEPGTLGSYASAPFWFVVLRAFAAGCTALTGIEAVSDGTQSFQKPEQKNASKVLLWMAIILSTLFLGMGYMVMHLPTVKLFSVKNPEFSTVSSQVAAYAFGSANHPGFYTVQAFTALILLLAANTAFADFPRVCSFLARDGYLPRYMARQGDRLVFHNGIIVLALAAIVLVYAFHGELDQLLPLYAVGVFTAFSLSQSGMVRYWLRHQGAGWKASLGINAFGAFLCICVLAIILVTKFRDGAWLVTFMLPGLYFGLTAIKNRYQSVARQQAVTEAPEATVVSGNHIALLLVPRVNRGILNALNYARNLKGEVQAVHVTLNDRALPELERQWQKYGQGVPLVVLASPYRSLIEPLVEYVDRLREADPNCIITVISPEAHSRRWYQRWLSENVGFQLKNALQKRRNVVVASPRYFLD